MKIFIVGDSTAANKTLEVRPETGWGEKIGELFTEQVQIDNHAVNGRSTKSFLAEERLRPIENQLTEEDYLFIQFGHNDQKVDDPQRFTTPYGTYLDNLLVFVDAARNKGATPVLLTSVTRRDYTDAQQLNPKTLGAYPAAMRSFAEEKNVPLLDIFNASQKYFNTLNPERTKTIYLHGGANEFPNYPNGIADNTHFQEGGAFVVAKLIAAEILKSQLPLKKHILTEKITF